MDIGTVHSIWTVILFTSFIGIIVWAYSKRQKSRFDEAANLVFADDELDKSTLESERSKEA
ncbi:MULTISPECIES: cbb3-type cytochrome oxidase subunit 3 [Photobacterium]|uniref:CcoQ/FixQ family Cbb3-type cytochrome c oxidase assembly chaperone n=1 Tax=Photobacterium leiognathi subsp. mandapamensis TaxID=48408 RepID=A0A0M9F6V0_PHOLD|nr:MULTISPECIES: CcoQ/FixQ family Cbb3-type cytochrome c oxidase assembly chaperone [Photobacterium]MBP2700306.1 CcoQ/FixQ family Cbb3-type cytochrome c oxidase assembly chaperone [Vibrio parahaemolyticus]KPA51137.1 cytochrome C oxidase [Photobacterium leiognathi subsp. mandapamensis]MZG58257.1 CcoQ/FixQ family Cbb3-type cytochrome c oxidase assembly chaperone [Photobacterium lucens]MZG81534.1 CcoQ/FixQ family Cbb3-type cytochrome c oxidase assembly chaperone [Photobacterium lucens]PHZ58742.1 